MQLTFRSNPKTTGWARRAAIAVLAGAGAMLLTLPVSFFPLLSHYERVTPNDTQNMLGALTVSVVVGIVAAVLCAAAAMVVFVLLGLYKPVPDAVI